jgi:hypothetical protein
MADGAHPTFPARQKAKVPQLPSWRRISPETAGHHGGRSRAGNHVKPILPTPLRVNILGHPQPCFPPFEVSRKLSHPRTCLPFSTQRLAPRQTRKFPSQNLPTDLISARGQRLTVRDALSRCCIQEIGGTELEQAAEVAKSTVFFALVSLFLSLPVQYYSCASS